MPLISTLGLPSVYFLIALLPKKFFRNIATCFGEKKKQKKKKNQRLNGMNASRNYPKLLKDKCWISQAYYFLMGKFLGDRERRKSISLNIYFIAFFTFFLFIFHCLLSSWCYLPRPCYFQGLFLHKDSNKTLVTKILHLNYLNSNNGLNLSCLKSELITCWQRDGCRLYK